MTAPTTQPLGDEPIPRAFVYDHVPTLKELLPKTSGLPGVEYAQISVGNIVKARDEEGWSKTFGAETYTIEGPKGYVHCELMSRGVPIRGQSTKSGARPCWVDVEVYQGTGLVDPTEGPRMTGKPQPKGPPKETASGSADSRG